MQQPQIEPSSVFGGTLAPGVVSVSNAYLSKPAFDREAETYTGTVYNGRGAIVPEALRPGGFAPFRPVDPVSIKRGEAKATVHIKKAIYGGHFFFAWGHFLIETLATAAYTNLPADVPVIFHPWMVTFESKWGRRYVEHVTPLLEAAWEKREIILAREALSVSELVIPRRLTAFGVPPTTIHPAVGTVFDRIRSRLTDEAPTKAKIVIVRDSTHRRAIEGETAIYDHLATLGFSALRPEEMSSEAQVSAMAGAEVVVGFSGSALHNAAFTPAGSTVIEIGDTAGRNHPNKAQADIARIIGHRLHFVPSYDGGGPRPAETIISDIECILASLR